MTIRVVVGGILFLSLGSCERPAPTPQSDAGAALEQTATIAGVIVDPTKIEPVGAYSSESDRVCVLPNGRGFRIGASVDYGDDQRCVVRGTAEGRDKLSVRIGEDCRFDATVDGERMRFPAILPPACDLACTGRASLAALEADLLSHATAEAQAMAGPDGRALCD